MTTENRRHLARVRNAFLGATALAGFAALSTPASAIVINDAYTPAQVVDTTNVTGVGQMVIDEQNGFIGLCTVSLINPRTVIFASHCVNHNPAGSAFMPATGYGKANGGLPIGFFFNANNNVSGNSAIGQWLNGVSGGPKDLTRTGNNAYNSNFVVYDKQCCTIGLGNNFLQADLAMAALDTPAVGIPTWTVLFSALSAPVHGTITGYGTNGTGSTGASGGIDYKRRTAENVISILGSLDDQDTFLFGGPDGLPANLYMMDFNDPKFGTAGANIYDFNIFHDKAYTKEGITAPGDSGGPLIVDHTFASPTIAAVLSGGDRFYNAQKSAAYGTTSFYQPLYLYWDWIVANNPYKYVTSTAGNHNWTDANAFVMALDPAYLTISGSSTVNALPTTPAQGIADVAPGFGTVCYFDVCVNIKTGVITNPTPPAGANPTDGTGVSNNYATTPFGGALGLDGFLSLAQGLASANGALQDCGATIVSVESLLAGESTPIDQACTAPSTGGGGGSGTSTNSDWLNPEGTALAAGVQVQGAPGASVGQVVNDVDANVATLSPARYYDVTIAAAGTITLPSGSITVDKVTVNGPSAALTVSTGASLTSLISFNSFAGTTTVNGTLNAAGGVNMFGGVLQGTGTINGPTGFLIGAVAPGTNGSVGTLTINGTTMLGSGSTTAIDVTSSGVDLLQINGAATVGGTLVASISNTVQQTSSYVFLKATGGITGAYNSVTDTLPGVLYPVVSKTTVGTVDQEVLSFKAGSFVTLLNGSGTADQTQIAAALDAARGAHYNDLLPLYQAIDPLSGAALGQALENLAPDVQRSATLVGDMQSTGFDGMIWQHLGDIGGASGGTHTGMLINGEGIKMALASASGTSAQSQQLVALGMGIATNPGAGNDPAPVGVPAAPQKADDSMLMLPNGMGGYVSGSSLAGSVVIGGGGGRADVRGLVIGAGVDMPVEDGLTVGVSFAYSDATATPRSIPSVLQSDAIQGALYAHYEFGENFIAEAYGAYGHQTISTHRTVVVGASTFNLSGHSGGNAPSAGISIGRSFTVDTINGAPLHLVPSFGLQYQQAEIDAFTETGGAPAMTFMGYSEASGLSRLGMDADMTFDIATVKFTPSVHMAWVENFSGNNGSIQSAFAGGPSSIMTFAMPARDRSYGELGLGVGIDLGDVLGHEATLSGRYDGNTRNDIQYGAWTGRLSIKF